MPKILWQPQASACVNKGKEDLDMGRKIILKK